MKGVSSNVNQETRGVLNLSSPVRMAWRCSGSSCAAPVVYPLTASNKTPPLKEARSADTGWYPAFVDSLLRSNDTLTWSPRICVLVFCACILLRMLFVFSSCPRAGGRGKGGGRGLVVQASVHHQRAQHQQRYRLPPPRRSGASFFFFFSIFLSSSFIPASPPSLRLLVS